MFYLIWHAKCASCLKKKSLRAFLLIHCLSELIIIYVHVSNPSLCVCNFNALSSNSQVERRVSKGKGGKHYLVGCRFAHKLHTILPTSFLTTFQRLSRIHYTLFEASFLIYSIVCMRKTIHFVSDEDDTWEKAVVVSSFIHEHDTNSEFSRLSLN